MTDDSDEALTLTPAGQKHRELILAAGLKQLDRRRRCRKASRAAAALLGAAAVVMAAWWVRPVSEHPNALIATPVEPADESSAIAPAPAPRRATAKARRSVVTIVMADATDNTRYIAKPNPSLIEIIRDDDRLIELLAQANRPAGLAYRDGETVVMFR